MTRQHSNRAIQLYKPEKSPIRSMGRSMGRSTGHALRVLVFVKCTRSKCTLDRPRTFRLCGELTEEFDAH